MTDRSRQTRILLGIILVLAASGGWISGQLLKRQANLWASSGDSGVFGRVCAATEAAGLGCAHHPDSFWAAWSVPLPSWTNNGLGVHRARVPVAFAGLAYFVFIGIWYATMGRPAPRARPNLSLIVATLGVAVSGFYLVTMATRLAPLCVWCAAVHIVNFAVFSAIRRLHRMRADEPNGAADVSDRIPCKRLAITAIVATTVAVGGLWIYRADHLAMGQQIQRLTVFRDMVTTLRDDPDFLRQEHYARPVASMPRLVGQLAADRPEIVMFMDYRCGPCICNAQRLQNLVIPAFDGAVDVHVRHLPVCVDCRAGRPNGRHDGCRAARAAIAARLQGAGSAVDRLHKLLLDRQGHVSIADCGELADRTSLDVGRFLRDLESPEVRDALRRDADLARALGVSDVPAMFLNGRRVSAFGLDNMVFWKTMAHDWADSRLQVGANR